LGQLYGSEAVGDPTTAARWHRVAAEAGNVWSMRDYARALMRGEGVERDPAAGFSWLLRSADGGNPYAQRDVGRAYLEGDAVQPDAIEAVRYLGLAAGSSDAGAADSAVNVLETVDARDRVRAVQTFLGELGFDAGPPDGMAGPATRAALAAATAGGLPPGDPQVVEIVAALAAATRSSVDGNAASADQGLPDRD
jgi:TPR repeat protein